ncbi:MAG: acyltransferase, partial [Algisphaera sp.]
AVAVLLVMLAHFGFDKKVPGGYGVTIFFFLSGFLITTLMRREFAKTGKIDLFAFYLRRTLRIFPPMYITMVVLMGVSFFASWVGMFDWKAILYQVFFLTNYLKIISPDLAHMQAMGLERPVGTGVYWSLAIEEHFYMGFPLLMLVFMPRLRRSRIALILLGTCVLGLAWRWVLIHKLGAEHHRTYYGTDTRLDSIMLGCVMALWGNPYLDKPFRFTPVVKMLLLAASLALTAFTLVYRDEAFRETWRYTLQGVALFPLFYLAITEHKSILFRWLDWAWLRYIGAISYTLYLIHLAVWSLLGLWKPEMTHPVRLATAAVISFAYAIAMYYLVEQPCARLRRKMHSKPKPAAA